MIETLERLIKTSKHDFLIRTLEERLEKCKILNAAIEAGVVKYEKPKAQEHIAIIHKSTREEGKLQISYFDECGAIGHSTVTNKNDILKTLIDYGYCIPAIREDETILVQ